MLTGHKRCERTLTGQTQKNLSRKITELEYNTRHKRNIHESIVIEINEINKWGRREKPPLWKNS